MVSALGGDVIMRGADVAAVGLSAQARGGGVWRVMAVRSGITTYTSFVSVVGVDVAAVA